MQESSIQFQHFWIDLILGLIMIYILIETPLEQALVGIAVVASFVFPAKDEPEETVTNPTNPN